ncbi:MAG: hypothetical protein FJ030_07895 [Chloroflexi bacterium]|nr:hypothetical protein [Chloroflexota bacterium]
MSRNIARSIGALTLLALFLTPLAALAHEETTAGNYVIEYGWVNEPPVAGEANALVINFSAKPEEHGHGDVSGTISLVAPADNSAAQGDRLEVTIAVEGIDEHDAESLHWHLYADDEELIMLPLSQTTATVTGLSNGEHTIKVAIAGSDHSEIGEPAQAKITVEGSLAMGEPMVEGVEAGGMDHSSGIQVDVSALKVEMIYGGQTTALTLQPLEGGNPGHFTAPFTPERPGVHTLRLTGKLSGDMGETDVDVTVAPEEVAPSPESLAAASSASAGIPVWVYVVGGVVIVAVVAVGVFALGRKK